MKARAKAEKKAFDLAITQAWHIEAFARQKQLNKLSSYIGSSEPRRPQTPEEMLAILQSFPANTGMKIELIN